MSRLTQMEYEIDFGIVSSRRLRGDQVNDVENRQMIRILGSTKWFRSSTFLVNRSGTSKLHTIRNRFSKNYFLMKGNFCIFLQFLSPSFPAVRNKTQFQLFSIFSLGSRTLTPKGESISISVWYLNNKKSFMFRDANQYWISVLFCLPSTRHWGHCINFPEVTKSPAAIGMKNVRSSMQMKSSKISGESLI